MLMSIGEVARAAGVVVDTIRFYEREGLIPVPSRGPANQRRYPAATVARVRFIRRARRLGFSLGQIGRLLALRVDSTTSAGVVRHRALDAISEIDEKLRLLAEIRSSLRGRARRCDAAAVHPRRRKRPIVG
ncbi:MAG: MerR family transcriptional regulator [Dehalococcoidia bacterium]|nr:MerR family transcriptional regulator [Dehalococcoidia bacterium]MCB9508191.1 MerR family transcriptional regulator [Myxococcales bacterium]